MTHLILLSHGSRHPRAHEGVERLAGATAALLGDAAASVRIAHLDFDPERTLDKVTVGVDRAVVVPLLFAGGFHTRYDVPQEIAAAEEATGARLRMAGILGASADVAELLAASVREHAAPDAHVVLYSVGSSIGQAQDNVRALAPMIADRTGRAVEFISATNMERSVADAVAEFDPVHLLPLFVTDGLLLDLAHRALGENSTTSGPLCAELATVVADRYRAAVALPR